MTESLKSWEIWVECGGQEEVVYIVARNQDSAERQAYCLCHSKYGFCMGNMVFQNIFVLEDFGG